MVLIGSLFVFYYSNIQAIGPTATPTYNSPTTTPFTDKSETPTPNPIIVISTTTTADSPSPTPSKPVYKIAFQDEAPYATSKKITVANLINLREISRLGVGKPEQADTTPDDTHTAIATSAGVIIFEGTELLKWIDPQSWATSVQFSPDGNILAIGLMTGEIQLWNWQSVVVEYCARLRHACESARWSPPFCRRLTFHGLPLELRCEYQCDPAMDRGFVFDTFRQGHLVWIGEVFRLGCFLIISFAWVRLA